MTTTLPLPRPTWPAGFCGQIGADAYSADQLEATRAPLLAEIERLTAELAEARAAIAAQAQVEPVAYWIPAADQFTVAKKGERPFAKAWEPLYTAPPPAAQPVRQPLTHEQVAEIWIEHGCDGEDAEGFARAVERAHGIAGEPAAPKEGA